MPLTKGSETALMATSVRLFQNTNPYIGDLPEELKSRTQYVSLEERSPLSVDKIYTHSRDFVMNFDEEIDTLLESIDIPEMERVSDDIVASFDKLGEIEEEKLRYMSLNREKLLKEVNDPSVVFDAFKHCALAEKTFEEISSRPDILKEGTKKLREEEDLEDKLKEKRDLLRAGIFIAAEPLLVFSIILADKKRDLDFLIEYTSILDQITFTLSHRAPEFYKDAVNFKRDKFREGTLDLFLEKKQKLRSKVSQ